MLINSPRKLKWKNAVKEAVHKLWTSKLRKEAHQMSSLTYLNIEACTTASLHPVWHDLHNPLAIRKATVKAQLMVQQYPLTTSPTAGAKCSDICSLCHKEPETTIHSLLHCRVMHNMRNRYFHHIMTTCRNNKISMDPEVLIHIILNSNHLQKKT